MELRLLGWPDDGPRLYLDHERFAYAGNFATGRTGIAVALGDDTDASAAGGATRADVDETEGARAVSNDTEAAPADADETEAAPADADDTETADDTGTVDGVPVVGAASFDPDRAVDGALRIRYVSVREDRRSEGIGPELLAFVVERALERGFERVRIGVNNPVAYRACYRAGFGFTGEESGMGELVLAAPADERSVQPEESPPSRYRDGLERFADRDLPPAQREVLERHRDGEPPAPTSRD